MLRGAEIEIVQAELSHIPMGVAREFGVRLMIKKATLNLNIYTDGGHPEVRVEKLRRKGQQRSAIRIYSNRRLAKVSANANS